MKSACMFVVIKEGVLNEPIFIMKRRNVSLMKKPNDKNIMKATVFEVQARN